jgi:TonB family protein
MNLLIINKRKFAFSVSIIMHLIIFSSVYILVKKNDISKKIERKNLEIVLQQPSKKVTSLQHEKSIQTHDQQIIKKNTQVTKKEVKQNNQEIEKVKKTADIKKPVEVNQTKETKTTEIFKQKNEPTKQISEQKKDKPAEIAVNKNAEEIKPKQINTLIQEQPKIAQKQSLENFLGTKLETSIDEKTKSYIKLYGKEFESFDKDTKKFLIDNLSEIGTVTKKYLTYPQISIRTNQQGLSAVEFILMPNGDIKELKLLQSSFYTALDQSTLRTVEIAYKDYPKPTKPTKIRIYVNYILR